MKKLSALLLLLIVSVDLRAQELRAGVLALMHDTVIDMTGAPPQRDMTVVITGNRITDIVRSSQMRIPGGVAVINAAGKFLIPGLWDMHVHFTEIERSFPLFIANVVTGVRNMGGESTQKLTFARQLAARPEFSPNFLAFLPHLSLCSRIETLIRQRAEPDLHDGAAQHLCGSLNYSVVDRAAAGLGRGVRRAVSSALGSETGG